jgi:phosphoglycolate phosphatase-like HAD superfamily hydrolase
MSLPRTPIDHDHVLVALDGPLCTVPADPTVADRLRLMLQGAKLPRAVARTDDPFAVLAHATTFGPATTKAVHDHLVSLEYELVSQADETPGSREALAALAAAGTRLTVVSRLSLRAVRHFLVLHDLAATMTLMCARTGPKLDRLPPNPYLVDRAVRHRGIPPESCLFVGATKWDLAAGRAAGVETVHYGPLFADLTDRHAVHRLG